MPPNALANVGRTMIGSWSRALLDQFRLQFAPAVEEVRVLGEWAFERGGYDRELRTAIDIRERLAALEARRVP